MFCEKIYYLLINLCVLIFLFTMTTIDFIPNEVFENVYSKLKLRDLAHSEQVCKQWKQMISGGPVSLWAKLFYKTFNFNVSNDVLEIKQCYQRYFRLLCNVRSDRMFTRFIQDIRTDLTDEPLVSRECVIFPWLRQVLATLECFKPVVESPKKDLLKVESKRTVVGYLEGISRKIFHRHKILSKSPRAWTVSRLLNFEASIFPKFSYQGRKNRPPQGWLKSGSATCFLGTGFSLQEIGKTILLSNQFFYMILNSGLKCEFVMYNDNPFIIRDGDTVFHQEGSWIVSYDIATRNYTGGLNVLESRTVCSRFAHVFSNSRILVPTLEGYLMMCDWAAKKVVWEKKFADSTILAMKVEKSFLAVLTTTGIFSVLNPENGQIVQGIECGALRQRNANYQQKILSGEGHFLIPYKDNTTLEVYKYGEKLPLFQKTYKKPILSVLVEKQRFVVLFRGRFQDLFCQINHLETGKEIACIPLIGQGIGTTTLSISDQILFVNYPLEDHEEFSHQFYFINLANGRILKKKCFQKSHKVSHVSFKDGLLTYRTHREGSVPEWLFHDFQF